ncbi:MAG: response regulator [Cyclobacteriaceae bacterium]
MVEKFKCIIVEDNPAHASILEYYVEKVSYLELIGTYSDSVMAALEITRKRPNLVFLDIEIKGLSGMEMMEALDKRIKTIVVTSHTKEKVEQFAQEFDVIIDGYIQKPIDDYEAFKKVLTKSLEHDHL